MLRALVINNNPIQRLIDLLKQTACRRIDNEDNRLLQPGQKSILWPSPSRTSPHACEDTKTPGPCLSPKSPAPHLIRSVIDPLIHWWIHRVTEWLMISRTTHRDAPRDVCASVCVCLCECRKWQVVLVQHGHKYQYFSVICCLHLSSNTQWWD